MLRKLIEAHGNRLVDIPIKIDIVPYEMPIVTTSVRKIQP